ncbi:unnamed protein product [Brassica oleracea var. botrytis]
MKVKTQQKLARAAVTSSSVRNSNPAQSSRRKSGQSSLRHSTSSRQKSVFPSSSTKTPMSSKRKHSELSSSKHHGSATTLPGSSDRSDKSKKKELGVNHVKSLCLSLLFIHLLISIFSHPSQQYFCSCCF